jgi:hypothetical protein
VSDEQADANRASAARMIRSVFVMVTPDRWGVLHGLSRPRSGSVRRLEPTPSISNVGVVDKRFFGNERGRWMLVRSRV